MFKQIIPLLLLALLVTSNAQNSSLTQSIFTAIVQQVQTLANALSQDMEAFLDAEAQYANATTSSEQQYWYDQALIAQEATVSDSESMAYLNFIQGNLNKGYTNENVNITPPQLPPNGGDVEDLAYLSGLLYNNNVMNFQDNSIITSLQQINLTFWNEATGLLLNSTQMNDLDNEISSIVAALTEQMTQIQSDNEVIQKDIEGYSS